MIWVWFQHSDHQFSVICLSGLQLTSLIISEWAPVDVLRVLCRMHQEFTPLLCFSLWEKRGSHSLSFSCKILFVMFWLAEDPGTLSCPKVRPMWLYCGKLSAVCNDLKPVDWCDCIVASCLQCVMTLSPVDWCDCIVASCLLCVMTWSPVDWCDCIVASCLQCVMTWSPVDWCDCIVASCLQCVMTWSL